MHALRQLGVLVLLLVSCLAPAMACMAPEAQMSAQEHACCRMMKNQCGQMEMKASHNCCRTTLGTVHKNALAAKTVGIHPVAVVAIRLTMSELFSPALVDTRSIERPERSLPKSPPSSVSILRI